MKIAQISNVFLRTPPIKYGGTEAVVSSLTEQLAELGHEVTLFATGDSITRANLWSWYKTPTHTFGLQDEIVHVVKAYEHIARSHFDIIHNHAYIFGPALLSFSCIPHLTTFHGIPLDHEFSYFEALSPKNYYVSISRGQQKVVSRLNWVGCVHNAVNVADFPFEPDKDDYLLFVGNIASWKGPHLAIQVAKTLGRHLKIAGPILEQVYFEQAIAPHIDGTMIEYVGEVDFAQKISLYQHSAVLLMPIEWEEPFGLVAIEALACGTPVIAFLRGAISEIILDGEVGFLVRDVDEMAAAVSNIKKISARRCREHVELYFNVKLMAERYVELYQKILEEWPRNPNIQPGCS